MATLDGAKALGMADKVGSLEVGKEADFILLDRNGLHAVPMFDPVTHLVYSASKSDVTDVYIAGQAVVRDRELLSVDTASIVRDVGSIQDFIRSSIAARPFWP